MTCLGRLTGEDMEVSGTLCTLERMTGALLGDAFLDTGEATLNR